MGTLIMILRLLPTIIGAVKALEEAIPISGAGKEKLDVITGVAEVVYGETTELQKDMPKDKLISILIKVVSMVVGMFNAMGWGTKKEGV